MVNDKIIMTVSGVTYVKSADFSKYKPGDIVKINVDNFEPLYGKVYDKPKQFIDNVCSDGLTKQVSYFVNVLMLDKISYPKLQYFKVSQLEPIVHKVR